MFSDSEIQAPDIADDGENYDHLNHQQPPPQEAVAKAIWAKKPSKGTHKLLSLAGRVSASMQIPLNRRFAYESNSLFNPACAREGVAWTCGMPQASVTVGTYLCQRVLQGGERAGCIKLVIVVQKHLTSLNRTDEELSSP